MAGRRNGRRNRAKSGEKASVQAGTEKAATAVVRPVAKTQAKEIPKAGSPADVVAEKKAGSKKKNVTEMKDGAVTDFSPQTEDKATKTSRLCSVDKVSTEFRSTCNDKNGIDTCFWGEEEATVGSLFGNGEEAGNHSSAKTEGKAKAIAPPSCAEKSEPVAGASYKANPGMEEDEDEDENVVGNWFWDGDETSFDPNPKPVSRIIEPQPVDAVDEKYRPRNWSETAVWPKAFSLTSVLPGHKSQAQAETRPPSYIILASAKENAHSVSAGAVAAEAYPSSSTACLSQAITEYPFDSEPCIQTIEEIRRQIRFREMNGIKPFACPCKMECYMNSEEFENLVSLLESTTDPLIHKIAQIAMGVINDHPHAQEFINEMGVVTLIECLLTFSSPEMRKNVVITLTPPSENERRRRAELHVKHMCKETMAFPLNSPGQQSGLKILGQMVADPSHHYIVAKCFSELFHLLSIGNRKTRNLILKVLVSMSENPTAARDMINTEALAELKLIFNQKEAKANLVCAVAIFINIKEHVRKGSVVVVDHVSYNMLMAIFREVKGIIETM